MRSFIQLAALAIAVTGSAAADSCPGGQLITENQFTTLLDHAPNCFKSGCGSNITSMSSACTTGSPCYTLWDFLRPSWQKENEWCKDCASDKACWITGWAVFNATQICNASPNISLFSNGGSCCASGNGPIELSQWLGGMCDEEEWRTRYFKDSYGMHPVDWYDHLRSLNFTVRPPGRNETVGYCDADSSWSATLRALGIQNLIDFAETLLEIIIFWALIIWGTELGGKKLKNWKHALVEGFTSGLMAVLGNLATVLVWVYALGYRDDRYSKTDYITQLFFTLCVRPSIVGYLCFLALLTRPLEQRMTRFGHYLAKLVLPIQHWWQKVLVALGFRRNRRSRPSSPDSDELDTINVDKARQFLANWAFIIAFAELFMQALSFPAVFWTVNAGRQRQLYSGVLSGDYLLTQQARPWYAGGMLHIIFWIPSVFMLLASSYVHLNRSQVQEWLATRGMIRYLFEELNRYYERRRIREEEDRLTNPDDWDDDNEASRRQGFLRRLLLSMAPRRNASGEAAPMIQRNPGDSASLESRQDSSRMGWARRMFLNLRIGAVSRLVGQAPESGGLREEERLRPPTPTERTALRSTSISHPETDPFVNPPGTIASPPSIPQMTSAMPGRQYQRVSTTTTDDIDAASPSPYAETSRYHDHPGHPPHTQDFSYRGHYGPSPSASDSTPLPARWHRPDTLPATSTVDDANYETHSAPSVPDLPSDTPRWTAPLTMNPPLAARPLEEDPAPGGPPHRLPGPSRSRRRSSTSRAPPFRLSGYIISHWPFQPILQSLYIWLSDARARQVAARGGRTSRPRGPDYGEFVELRRVVQDIRTAGLPRWRRIALWGTFLTVTVNYVSQWLWWAGFVQVLGDRWCPPDFDFKLEKGIWAAGNFMLVLVSLGFAMFGSGEPT